MPARPRIPLTSVLASISFLVLVLGSSAWSQEGSDKPASRPATGALSLIVRYEGKPPVLPPFGIPPAWRRMFKNDGEFCQKCLEKGELFDERLQIGKTGGVRNVAVSFPRLKAPRADSGRPVLDNLSCRFSPHVFFVPVGESILVKNSDPLTHNAHLRRKGGRPFCNLLVPARGSSRTPKISRPGLYEVSCDIHPWMKAFFIGTRNACHTVTDEAGKGVIEGIPPGRDLLLVLWHETLGSARKKVSISPGSRVELRLTQKDFKR